MALYYHTFVTFGVKSNAIGLLTRCVKNPCVLRSKKKPPSYGWGKKEGGGHWCGILSVSLGGEKRYYVTTSDHVIIPQLYLQSHIV